MSGAGPLYDVVVVGAGPRALATALGLAHRGARVVVLDTTGPTGLPWSEVHHWSVLPGLEDLGVLDALLARGDRTTSWGLRVRSTGEDLVFDVGDLADQDVPYPFGLRVLETDVREVLLARLRARQGDALRTPARVVGLAIDEESVTVATDSGSLRARWVIADDGPASVVRRLAGIGFEGISRGERCTAALVRHDFAATGCPDVTLVVDDRYGAVLERVSAATWRYLFAEPATLPEEGVAERIHEVLHVATGAEPDLLAWTSARMHERTAATYRAGRVLLIGDAAHLTHPMIGHTSISGWFDAFSVARAIGAVLTGADEDVVDRWAEERRRVYSEETLPAAVSRKNLLTQISDPRRLAIELDEFRRALVDVDLRRRVLLRGREFAGADPCP